MKIVKKIQMKIVIFYTREKSLYVAWACFRIKDFLEHFADLKGPKGTTDFLIGIFNLN